MKYVIKKSKKKYNIIDIKLDEGYIFTPRENIDIQKLIIYDPKFIEKILTIKFNTSFKKLAQLILEVVNDEEPNSEDVLMIIGEISRQKGIVLNKYNKFLNNTIQKNMLKKIGIIEAQLKEKLMTYTISKNDISSEKKRAK